VVVQNQGAGLVEGGLYGLNLANQVNAVDTFLCHTFNAFDMTSGA
jgi:hypothetical protein